MMHGQKNIKLGNKGNYKS